MTEGEFKKLIDAIFPIHYGVQLEGILELKKILFRTLDEAAKEFPLKGFKMENEEYPLISVTEHYEFDMPTREEFIELLKWFVKYFGLEEKLLHI